MHPEQNPQQPEQTKAEIFLEAFDIRMNALVREAILSQKIAQIRREDALELAKFIHEDTDLDPREQGYLFANALTTKMLELHEVVDAKLAVVEAEIKLLLLRLNAKQLSLMDIVDSGNRGREREQVEREIAEICAKLTELEDGKRKIQIYRDTFSDLNKKHIPPDTIKDEDL